MVETMKNIILSAFMLLLLCGCNTQDPRVFKIRRTVFENGIKHSDVTVKFREELKLFSSKRMIEVISSESDLETNKSDTAKIIQYKMIIRHRKNIKVLLNNRIPELDSYMQFVENLSDETFYPQWWDAHLDTIFHREVF